MLDWKGFWCRCCRLADLIPISNYCPSSQDNWHLTFPFCLATRGVYVSCEMSLSLNSWFPVGGAVLGDCGTCRRWDLDGGSGSLRSRPGDLYPDSDSCLFSASSCKQQPHTPPATGMRCSCHQAFSAVMGCVPLNQEAQQTAKPPSQCLLLLRHSVAVIKDNIQCRSGQGARGVEIMRGGVFCFQDAKKKRWSRHWLLLSLL